MFKEDKESNVQKEGGSIAQRGFEYQQQMTTYICFMMYLSIEGYDQIKEVYCELDDDILLITNNNKQRIIQVTYNNSNTPFCLNDSKITKTLDKFLKLKNERGDVIESFKIITNTGFIGIIGATLREYIGLRNKKKQFDNKFNNKYEKLLDIVELKKGVDKQNFMDIMFGKLHSYFGDDSETHIKNILQLVQSRSTLADYEKDITNRLDKPDENLRNNYKRINHESIRALIGNVKPQTIISPNIQSFPNRGVSLPKYDIIEDSLLDKIVGIIYNSSSSELKRRSAIDSFDEYSRDKVLIYNPQTWKILHYLIFSINEDYNVYAMVAIRNIIQVNSDQLSYVYEGLKDKINKIKELEDVAQKPRIKEDVAHILYHLLDRETFSKFATDRIINAIKKIDNENDFLLYVTKYKNFFKSNKTFSDDLKEKLYKMMDYDDKEGNKAKLIYEELK
jgi:hypothetical protein